MVNGVFVRGYDSSHIFYLFARSPSWSYSSAVVYVLAGEAKGDSDSVCGAGVSVCSFSHPGTMAESNDADARLPGRLGTLPLELLDFFLEPGAR